MCRSSDDAVYIMRLTGFGPWRNVKFVIAADSLPVSCADTMVYDAARDVALFCAMSTACYAKHTSMCTCPLTLLAPDSCLIPPAAPCLSFYCVLPCPGDAGLCKHMPTTCSTLDLCVHNSSRAYTGRAPGV